MENKTDNDISAKTETILHYILVVVILVITTPAFYMGVMNGTDYKWIVMVVVGLAVGFDTVKEII